MEIQQQMFEFLPSSWRVDMGTSNSKLILLAPDQKEARYLVRGAKNAIAKSAEKLGAVIEILIEGAATPFAVFGESASPLIDRPLNEILPPVEDPEWQKVASDMNIPVWVFDHYDLTTLWANRAALAPQAKSEEEIVGKDGSSLDKPEELDRIAHFLEADGSIDAMEFNGYRWGRMEENSRIYTRIEHTFVEHWKLIDWQGKSARLGVVLQATPVF